MPSTDATPGPADDLPLLLRVDEKTALARDIWGFTLRHPDGAALPPATPGAHVAVQLPGGARRQYSLCGDPADASAYRLAVKRDASGRGGSIAMADAVHAGALLRVGLPTNAFALVEPASSYLFIAGGIGITPILSMVLHLQAQGQGNFRLVYCTRDAEHTAFADVLGAPELAGRVTLYHDHGDPSRGFDFWPLLERSGRGHIYCCGPRGLMDAVADMSGHWPAAQVHFERFGVDTQAFEPDLPFEVRLQRSGTTLSVAPGQSVLEALRAGGHHVPSSCESGTCGSCRTPLLGGDVEHRDLVLSEDERRSQVMVCVSRARGGEMVLDL